MRRESTTLGSYFTLLNILAFEAERIKWLNFLV